MKSRDEQYQRARRDVKDAGYPARVQTPDPEYGEDADDAYIAQPVRNKFEPGQPPRGQAQRQDPMNPYGGPEE